MLAHNFHIRLTPEERVCTHELRNSLRNVIDAADIYLQIIFCGKKILLKIQNPTFIFQTFLSILKTSKNFFFETLRTLLKKKKFAIS